MSKLERIFEAKVKMALRRLTWSWEPYQKVKNASKVAPATFACRSCGKWCYTGKSKDTLNSLTSNNVEKVVEMGPIYIDHIEPVETLDNSTEKGYNLFDRLDIFIRRLFCSEDNLQPLCKSCHDIKTSTERKERDKARRIAKASSTSKRKE